MQWLKYRSLFLPPLTVQGECLWSTGGYSLHPVVLLFLEALSSSSLTRKKERESLKGVCPVIICMFPAFIPLDCTSHIATSNCERDWEMYSSYVQRKERLTFGKELSVSATICSYSPKYLFKLYFLHIDHTYSRRELTSNSILSLHRFQNSGFWGDVQFSN